MQLCNRAHHNLQTELFILCSPELDTWKGTEARRRFPVQSGRAVTGTSTTPDYVTRGVPGLYKQPPCALLWDSHTTGTLNVSTKDLISLIKQFIAHNMEIALGLCFHYLPLSLNPTSNSAQIKVGVF